MPNNSISYLAGLFDGEGTFSIQVVIRSSSSGRKNLLINPRMTLTLKYGQQAFNILVQELGGTLYNYPKEGCVRWSLGKRKDLLVAASKLLPELVIKKEICANFIKALKLFPETRKAHAGGQRSWSKENALAVARIALSLNPYKKSPKTAIYLEEIERIYC